MGFQAETWAFLRQSRRKGGYPSTDQVPWQNMDLLLFPIWPPIFGGPVLERLFSCQSLKQLNRKQMGDVVYRPCFRGELALRSSPHWKTNPHAHRFCFDWISFFREAQRRGPSPPLGGAAGLAVVQGYAPTNVYKGRTGTRKKGSELDQISAASPTGTSWILISSEVLNM